MSFIQPGHNPVLLLKALAKVTSQPSKTIIPELIKTYFQNRLSNNTVCNFECNPKIAVCKAKTAVRIDAVQKTAAAG